MYCAKCGIELESNVKFCGSCGCQIESFSEQDTQQKMTQNMTMVESKKVYAKEKKPILALLLSLLIVGMGQIYNGDTKKGIIMLLVAIGAGIFSAGILWLLLSIWSAFDAYAVAKKEKSLWV